MKFFIFFSSLISFSFADTNTTILMNDLGFTDINDYHLYMGFLGILIAFIISQRLP